MAHPVFCDARIQVGKFPENKLVRRRVDPKKRHLKWRKVFARSTSSTTPTSSTPHGDRGLKKIENCLRCKLLLPAPFEGILPGEKVHVEKRPRVFSPRGVFAARACSHNTETGIYQSTWANFLWTTLANATGASALAVIESFGFKTTGGHNVCKIVLAPLFHHPLRTLAFERHIFRRNTFWRKERLLRTPVSRSGIVRIGFWVYFLKRLCWPGVALFHLQEVRRVSLNPGNPQAQAVWEYRWPAPFRAPAAKDFLSAAVADGGVCLDADMNIQQDPFSPPSDPRSYL